MVCIRDTSHRHEFIKSNRSVRSLSVSPSIYIFMPISFLHFVVISLIAFENQPCSLQFMCLFSVLHATDHVDSILFFFWGSNYTLIFCSCFCCHVGFQFPLTQCNNNILLCLRLYVQKRTL